MRVPVENDPDVRKAIEWLYDSSTNSDALHARINIARDHYLENARFENHKWQDPRSLTLPKDPIASYLAQAEAFLGDRNAYDARIGPRVLPFLKSIGQGLELLQQMPGASERAQRLISPNNDHPDSGLFEFATAVRYAREIELEVEFIPEGHQRMADIRASNSDGEFHIECKRLRSSAYEEREVARVRTIFAEFDHIIAAKKLSVYVDVVFLQEIESIPPDYLAQRVGQVAASRIFVWDCYPWRDEYAEGVVRLANVDAVHRDTRDSDLIVGPKMARLLSGQVVSEGSYFLAVGGKVSKSDPRYLDTMSYGSVLTWNCIALASIEARGRYIRSKLADIDRQLEHAPVGIAHIGMDAERDTKAADLRREKNREAIVGFQAKSALVDIELHYFMPRVSENHSWMIDETVDSFSTSPGPALRVARIIVGNETELTDRKKPAWYQPPPSHET